MWKFASHSWYAASGQRLRRAEAPTMTDGDLTVVGMMIIWTSFVFVVFPQLDLAVARLFAHGHVFRLAENPFLKAVRDVSRMSQPYLLGAMAVIVILHVFLPRRFRFCLPHKPLFVLLSFAAGPLLVVQTLKVTIGRVRPRDLIEFGGPRGFHARLAVFGCMQPQLLLSVGRSRRCGCRPFIIGFRACQPQMAGSGDLDAVHAVRGVQPRPFRCPLPVGCDARMALDHVCHGDALALDGDEF
jgi:hypothetical protein